MLNTCGNIVDKLRKEMGKNCVRLSTSVQYMARSIQRLWGQPLVFRIILPIFPPYLSARMSRFSPLEYCQLSPLSTRPIIRATK